MRMRVPAWYGRFETSARKPSHAPSLMKSSASPFRTESAGGEPSAPASLSASTGSFSMAVTEWPRMSSPSVSTPSPGPISRTFVGSASPAASRMSSRALRSIRKFCPSVRFGWKPFSMHHALTWLGLVRFTSFRPASGRSSRTPVRADASSRRRTPPSPGRPSRCGLSCRKPQRTSAACSASRRPCGQ